MTLQILMAFAAYAFVTCITPGPNNTMLLASGANYGFRATLPLLFGINLGFSAMVLAIGFGLGGFFAAFPVFQGALRYAGSLYLLYLAWKIAGSGAMGAGGGGREPIRFLQAFAFQWVNPKAWIMAIGAIAAYTPADGYFGNILIVTLVYALVNAPCIAAWAAFGAALRGVLSRPAALRAFNIGMALLLAASLYPILSE